MRKIAILLCFAMLFFACSKKEVKTVSQESNVTLEAFALAEKLKNAFISGDTETVRAATTEEGYKKVTGDKRDADSIVMTFTPRWVEIDKNKIYVNIAWNSTWILAGKRVEERGMAVFIMEGKPMKLNEILRANPFKYPEK